jgi:oxygen-independent coproporphyrinogen-3 oxidase
VPPASPPRPRHVYVHVPFCARRCSYCDFAIAVRRAVPVGEYVQALAAETAGRFGAAEPVEPWTLDTLYLGGGTPSRLGGEGVAAAIAAVRRHASLAEGAEVTVEANPDDVDPAAAAAWVAAGVNRLSLGVQTFSEAALGWMHRSHGAERAAEAVAAARDAGLGNVSVDLIFALPSGVARSWERDLEAALALEPTHVSLYGLTVEPHTPLGRWHERGEVVEADEGRYEAEFLRAHDDLARAGFEHYEVSNFARPGRRSRHNSSYWSGAPYAGLGPSAHEYDGERRRWNVSAYADWVRRLGAGTDPVDGVERLTPANREAETVYLGLRTADGLALRPDEGTIVAPWVSAGWATLDGGVLRLTPLGWLRLDALAASLTAHRSR